MVVTESRRAELIALAREWIEHAPEAKPGPEGLVGYTGDIGFICADCAGRILGRGCNINKLATTPVWDKYEGNCNVCSPVEDRESMLAKLRSTFEWEDVGTLVNRLMGFYEEMDPATLKKAHDEQFAA